MKITRIFIIILLAVSLLALPVLANHDADETDLAPFETSVPVSSRGASIASEDVEEVTGLDVSESDFTTSNAETEGNFIVIAIFGSGPDVKFSILERRFAFPATVAGSDRVDVVRKYSGKISVSSRKVYNVVGSDLSKLRLLDTTRSRFSSGSSGSTAVAEVGGGDGGGRGGGCFDTDEGKEIYEKGIAAGIFDSCTSPTQLAERYCTENNEGATYAVDCPNGYFCSDGACTLNSNDAPSVAAPDEPTSLRPGDTNGRNSHIDGIASFEFTGVGSTLTITLSSGDSTTYKIDSIERRPVRKTDSGSRGTSVAASEEASSADVLKRIFSGSSDARAENTQGAQVASDSTESSERVTDRPTLFQRFRDFFFRN